MTIMFRRILMILAVAVLLPCLTQTARADTVANFGCVITCGGTGVKVPGPPFSATITNLASNVNAGSWTFSFSTLTNTASLTDGSNLLNGQIGSNALFPFGPTSEIFTLGVIFQLTSLSAPDVSSFFGGVTQGLGPAQVSFRMSNGYVDSASVQISPVPEPGSIALLGTGLLLCGRLLRRKKQDEEAAA
jgi:hypothetical protein